MARRELTADGYVHMPYEEAALPLLRAMPGARWEKPRRRWRVSTNPEDRDRLLELADLLRLDVAPELRTVTVLKRGAEERIEELMARTGLQPYPFQRDGILWLLQHTRALLADDMGLGKTMQALWALPDAARALVICPSGLKYNWQAECERWRPDLSPIVLEGWGSFRLPGSGEVVIVNFELLPPTEPRTAKGDKPKKGRRPWEPDCYSYDTSDVVVIVDEASFARNTKSERGRATRQLASDARRCWLLTGTPLMNRPMCLWGTLRAGDMHELVFRGWGGFTHGFRARKNRWGGYEFGQPRPEVAEKLRRLMIRRKKDDVLDDLPPVRTREVICRGVGKQLQLRLDTAMEYWVSEGQTRRKGALPRELPPFEEFSELRMLLAESRISDMLSIVEQHEETETPLVVFSAHRAPIEELHKRAGWEVILGGQSPSITQGVVKRFQAGELKGVGLSIRAGGYGHTLTRASHVLFVDLSWVPSENRQAIDRVRRIGQKASRILVTRLVSDHALDRHVLKLLDEKQEVIDRAVDKLVGQPEGG
jgi:SWI/SNF-related matrix-associated actin-dependent regulator 1 of chromatin subfamily A